MINFISSAGTSEVGAGAFDDRSVDACTIDLISIDLVVSAGNRDIKRRIPSPV